MSPRGGRRTPGEGRKLGRPRIHPEGEPRPRETIPTTISLYPDEHAQLDAICAELGIGQSDFVRRAIAHAWVLKLAPEQLAALRSLAGLKEE
jgi:hypothetical protein